MKREILNKIEPIVRAAGDVLLSHFRKDIGKNKKSDESYVTLADIESEKYLVDQLHKIFPEAAFWAEESGISGKLKYTWVIDPLDGTTNYIQGLPHFCISVALTEDNEPVLGVVYNPILNEYFSASRDGGAYLNGQPIKVSSQSKLEDSVVVACLPYKGVKSLTSIADKVAILSKNTYSLRILGSAALDQAYVACGRLDAIVFGGLNWWDIAAGKLIIQEAGGSVMNFQGKIVLPSFDAYVAGNSGLCKAILELL